MERIRCPNPKCGRHILDIEEMPPGLEFPRIHLKNDKKERYIHFEDAEVPPVPAGKTGHPVNPEMDLLSIILHDFNDMFGNINWNDADHVRRQILEIPQMVAKDERYQNAMKNSDEQNARMESERALQQVIFAIMADNMELFKQFQDNPSFKKWLSDMVFNQTYEPEEKKSGTRKVINYSDYQPPASMVAEEPATYDTDKQ